MLTVGFDIDNTLTDTSGAIRKYIIENPNEFEDPEQLLKDIANIINVNRISKDINKFLDEKYPLIIKQVKLRKGVIELLTKLQGLVRIVIITARSDKYFPEGAEQITQDYFAKEGVLYDELYTHSHNKVDICEQEDICLFIDDSKGVCLSLMGTNTLPIQFLNELNSDEEIKEILRTDDYNYIYDLIMAIYYVHNQEYNMTR